MGHQTMLIATMHAHHHLSIHPSVRMYFRRRHEVSSRLFIDQRIEHTYRQIAFMLSLTY